MVDSKKRPGKDLDRIDRNILNELQKDGRISNVELSKRVGLSPTPCLERVRRLERQGFIQGYTARNAWVYGEKTVALWQLSTSRMASVHAIRRFH